MANTQNYINHLLQNTGITPACSEEERLAAEDIAQIFRNHGFDPEVQEFNAPAPSRMAFAVTGILAFAGALLMGIGGGIVHVPFMVYVLNFPVHVAIATSTCILAVSSLAGLVSHAMLGHIVWTSGLAIGAGAFVGAQGGVALAQRLQSGILMKLASVLVLITGIKFLLNAL